MPFLAAQLPVRIECLASAVPNTRCLLSPGATNHSRHANAWGGAPRRHFLRHQQQRQQRGGVFVRAARDPYEVLGVSRGADAKAIKAAYRKKALKLHPDVNKAPNAKDQFMEAKQAFQALTEGRAGGSSRQSSQSSGGGFDWANPFGSSSSGSSGGSSSAGRQKQQSEEPFYGFTEFFGDLEKEWGERKKRRGKEEASLWEELADIGEEFVEFLEHELGLSPQAAQEAADNSDSASRDAAARDAAARQATAERHRRDTAARAAAGAEKARADAEKARANAAAEARRAADELKAQADRELEDMLAELKRKMQK
mmetsp:Transcript_5198/g.14914  ORF Transcript_5198/g.14914 Transcript_5198/m.14914 type:complete len:312 (-) Transcript_5198:1045-1980(-)|eukprot:CAMPEP_0206150860 /NCGR_PEP_ID=MMETSP1473-20131121/38525_1 /ASSEMBLY_ACC=CAM_ASM_001109 /TAXON_ID=1461547 /ORGANISM="Stichococcus sp, Strain RCC1054" /LENGTH=311 /DNA_ID=CAMNT_0053548389 /DNA_START=220 /DNA_END=1155 /DNA_ORIENTATION=+